MNDNYSGEAAIYAGMIDPNPPVVGDQLSNVTVFSEDANVPSTATNQTFILNLHASGGSSYTYGRQYRADLSERLSYLTYNTWGFATVRGSTVLGNASMLLRPTDYFDRYPSNSVREGYWMGFIGMEEPARMRLIVERRLDALMRWADANLPIHPTKRCITGGSMGAWGTLTYGIRRANKFAALYPDRPRVRYSNYSTQGITIPNWSSGSQNLAAATAPLLLDEDGGYSVAQHMDIISYASNTSNKIPWVGWCIGVADGFTAFQDHIDFVNALRAAKRGFAFAFNGGNHSTGSILNQVTNSYPYGTFEIGKGYPLFTNHSGDDPLVAPTVGDLTVRGINLGLSFRNVVEAANSWSCEVTSILGARTVTVEPISSVFTAAVAPQNVSIPAANTWVPVSFTI